MSEIYLFNDKVKLNKITEWFDAKFFGTVVLVCPSPVIFSVDDVIYTTKYFEQSKKIYCKKLYGENPKPYHEFIIDKVEKFLNKLKDEN